MTKKVILRLRGGLGNQMFQYAYGRSLSLAKQKKLVLDLGDLKFPAPGETKREFGLDKFKIKAEIITTRRSWLIKFWSKIKSRLLQQDGYYQSEKYFRDYADFIRQDFALKHPLAKTAQRLAEEIFRSPAPVSIHVRRGDYISNAQTNSYHGTCDLAYYARAVQYLKTKIDTPTFFIFSDDIAWVKNNLQLENAIYVSSPNIPDYEELILMSQCRHHIIANSSFSWWGAWLGINPGKIVIAPVLWLTNQSKQPQELIPPNWLRL